MTRRWNNWSKRYRQKRQGKHSVAIALPWIEVTVDTTMEAASSDYPCPHARPSWRMCPWCLGINDQVQTEISNQKWSFSK